MKFDTGKFRIQTKKHGVLLIPQDILLYSGELITETENYNLLSVGAQSLQTYQGQVTNTLFVENKDNDWLVGRFPEGFFKYSIKKLIAQYLEATTPKKDADETPKVDETPKTPKVDDTIDPVVVKTGNN